MIRERPGQLGLGNRQLANGKSNAIRRGLNFVKIFAKWAVSFRATMHEYLTQMGMKLRVGEQRDGGRRVSDSDGQDSIVHQGKPAMARHQTTAHRLERFLID